MKKIAEHSGCGWGNQVDQITVSIPRGEVVVQLSADEYARIAALEASPGCVVDEAMIQRALDGRTGLNSKVRDHLRHPDQHNPRSGWPEAIMRTALLAATPVDKRMASMVEHGMSGVNWTPQADPTGEVVEAYTAEVTGASLGIDRTIWHTVKSSTRIPEGTQLYALRISAPPVAQRDDGNWVVPPALMDEINADAAKWKQRAEALAEVLAYMVGVAETDRMDDKSNVWRGYMNTARELLGIPSTGTPS